MWQIGLLSWKLHEGQARIYKAIKALPGEVREVLLLISRRWGKSYLGVVMALEDCLQGPNRQVLIVGPNLKQTRKIIAPLIRLIAQDAPAGLIKETKSDLTWQVGQSQLLISAFDTAPEAIRGIFADAIYLEESGSSNGEEFEYVIDSVLRPTLMHSRGRIIHLTTPSRFVDHPLHTVTLPKCQHAGSLFRFTIRDNPLLTSAQIEEEIQTLGGRESIAARRELFCEILRDETVLAVPEFNASQHVRTFDLPNDHIVTVSGDLGGIKDRSAIHFLSYDFPNNRVLVFDELAFDNTTATVEIAQAALAKEKEWRAPARRKIDAPGQIAIDLGTTYGWPISAPSKPKGSLESGINAIRQALSEGALWIHPRCKLLIATLESQTFNSQRTDLLRTAALGHGDALMSLVYGLRHLIKDNPTNPLKGKSRSDWFIDRETNQITHPILKAFR